MKRKVSTEPKKGLHIRIGEDLLHDFRVWCARNDTTMTSELLWHIEDIVYWCLEPTATTPGEQEGGTG